MKDSSRFEHKSILLSSETMSARKAYRESRLARTSDEIAQKRETDRVKISHTYSSLPAIGGAFFILGLVVGRLLG